MYLKSRNKQIGETNARSFSYNPYMYDPESNLRNLYTSYMFRNKPDSTFKLSRVDKLRFLGGMEALLQCLYQLPSGIPFQYKKVDDKFLWIIPYKRNETYHEYILRKTLEFLRESPNTPPTTFLY